MKPFAVVIFLCLFLGACKKDPPIETGALQLVSVSVGPEHLSMEEVNVDLPFDQPVVIRFSQILDTAAVKENVVLLWEDEHETEVEYAFLDNRKTISLLPRESLLQSTSYSLQIGPGLKGAGGETFPGLDLTFVTRSTPLAVWKIFVDGKQSENGSRITGATFTPEITVHFSAPVNAETLENYTSLALGSLTYNHLVRQENDSVLTVDVQETLPDYRKFLFVIDSELGSAVGKDFSGTSLDFYTMLDSTDKFPLVTDEQLLDIVQEQTFSYFWDFAHPFSGLSRERNTADQTVTSGGSGFGVMAILVGIERGYISRPEGVARLRKIVDFLGTADRFHGAWSHWLSGSTGDVIPFSSKDDGGDLVETSYMAMGLLTVRQYLDVGDVSESALINDIDVLLDAIEWDWYTQGENSLTWHWSPNYGFEKNHKIRGWNEALITYVLAASSKNHGISREVYEQGWGSGSNMINGDAFYGITLPLGRDYGGPLFFEQYTFIGLDPRNLSDQYADYWQQAVNHTLINRQHCIVNPNNYVGYSADCWGLTASDGDKGYSAHAPHNDRGVIAPTAAVSSIPFTPEESMEAMRHFYYKLGDRIWGPYGFYDAFNVTTSWFGTSNIAIDQGPIILMIENYRSGLLWSLFMSAPEVKAGLTKLGFTY